MYWTMHCQSRISGIVAEWPSKLDEYLKQHYFVGLLNRTKVNGFNTIIKQIRFCALLTDIMQ